jgi:prepilin-type N-terminal cleavage/methylation domain-containing protein
VARLIRTFVLVPDLGGDVARPSVGADVAAAAEERQQHCSHESPDESCVGFTLIEVVMVIAIILILAGLVLAVSGFVQEKGKRSRAEAEIAAISAALESYKADNGIYPRDPTPNTATDKLDARTMGDPVTTNTVNYKAAGLVLYRALSGDRNLDRTISDADKNLDIDGSTLGSPLTQVPKGYFTFRPAMLLPLGTGNAIALADPFGNSYGYSTANQYNANTGYNPTFDLWSTASNKISPTSDSTVTQKWIKNW